ncbi:MAG: SH3 type 3 domain-containing protein [Candidatus Tokpelaia hoelldobleri]|uniref:SH3 type 3 domain-containing protein n=1 Tax=Candidatus Tokpelaia hoelldobleri TaxID=1902579 RepID=A0A1U9JU20_9HYPH|nr:MAG: SH3 type 3 domain-containing protein [Candidatus Tokpelaia hoelldoblerii]
MKRLLASLLVLGSMVLGGVAAQAADAISTGSVNMRSGPGTRYAVRTAIPARAPLQVAGCRGNWCQVNFQGRIGWVSAGYLAFRDGRAAAAPRYAPAPQTSIVIGGFWGPGYYNRRHYRHGGYRSHRGPRYHHRGRYYPGRRYPGGWRHHGGGRHHR